MLSCVCFQASVRRFSLRGGNNVCPLPGGLGGVEVIVVWKLNFGGEGNSRKGAHSELAPPLSSPAWPKPCYTDSFEGAVIQKQM